MRLLHRWMVVGMDIDSQGLCLFSLPSETALPTSYVLNEDRKQMRKKVIPTRFHLKKSLPALCGLNMQRSDWFFSINSTQWINTFPCRLAASYGKLVGTCADFACVGSSVCKCVTGSHSLSADGPPRHVEITPANCSLRQPPFLHLAVLTLDAASCSCRIHQRHVLTRDNADTPREIKLCCLVMSSAGV